MPPRAKRATKKAKSPPPPPPPPPDCPECARLGGKPKAWISASCGKCAMPVYFTTLAERNAYVQAKTVYFARHDGADLGGVTYSPAFEAA